ncbi:gag-pol polyprotein [Tanacetum coccineum]
MLFDNTIKWVDSFVLIDSEDVEGSKSQTEGSSKRTGEELESDHSKKQKIDENVEAEVDDKAKMKKHMEIVPDDEVAIDAIPLAIKPHIMVIRKIIKEGKMGYFQIIRADGSSRRNTRPEEAYERVLWGDLKVMFEPDVESEGVMVEELTALHQIHTWDLVPLPTGKCAIGSRWVYKIKTKSNGFVKRYKGRLVVEGYSQEYGMDYEETFAHNAFLNGYLNEEVYMKPPPGIPHQLGEVCKLRKALYGLKQAPRAWYEKFSIVVTSLGFISSNHDSALFVKCSSDGRILLSLYVDDMIITGDDCNGIESLKAKLSHRFAMKDLGLLRYFFGIEVASSPKGYLLFQSKYIDDLFDRARMIDNMIADIPIDAKAKYTPTDGNPLPDPSLYRTIFVTTSEIVWLRWLLADMGVHITSPTPLYCNNRRAIQIARNTVFHERTKHIEIDCHFTRHNLQAGTISLSFVPSALQIVDIFTKPHCDLLSRFLSDKLSMFIVAAL